MKSLAQARASIADRRSRAPCLHWFVGRACAGMALGALVIFGCSEPERTNDAPLGDPETRALVQRAQEALTKQQYQYGLALADSAIQRSPGAADPYFVRGRLLFELNRFDEAGRDYEKVAEIEPDYPGVWHNLGNVSFQQRQFRGALRQYERELAQREVANAWHGLGGTYWSLGVRDSAEVAYRRAIAVDPSYAAAFVSLADARESDGDFAGALEYARAAMKLQPDNMDIQYRVGALLSRNERHAEAVAILEPVVAARPWDYGAMFALGQALVRLGRQSEGNEMLERANGVREKQAEVERLGRMARDQPGSFEVYVQYANALRSSGRMVEALKAYHVAQSLRPNNLGLQNNIATIYLQQGDVEEALSRYRAVLSQDSTYAEAWLNLALHYARTGNQKEANRALERAARHGKDNPTVQRFLNSIGQ